jgi:hypothetical protein
MSSRQTSVVDLPAATLDYKKLQQCQQILVGVLTTTINLEIQGLRIASMTNMERLKLSQQAVNSNIYTFRNIIKISINCKTNAMFFDS